MHIIIEDQEATPNLKNNTKARNKFATSASQGVEREREYALYCVLLMVGSPKTVHQTWFTVLQEKRRDHFNRDLRQRCVLKHDAVEFL